LAATSSAHSRPFSLCLGTFSGLKKAARFTKDGREREREREGGEGREGEEKRGDVTEEPMRYSE